MIIDKLYANTEQTRHNTTVAFLYCYIPVASCLLLTKSVDIIKIVISLVVVLAIS